MDLPTIISLSEEAFDFEDVLKQITLPSSGASVMFTGIVRGKTYRGHKYETVELEYDLYQVMAEEKAHQIAREIRQQWPEVEGIAIIQRIGKFQPGMVTTLVACTAAHRDTGIFDATRYGIDRLKEIVPVWKKEIGPGGESWVEGTYFPAPNE